MKRKYDGGGKFCTVVKEAELIRFNSLTKLLSFTISILFCVPIFICIVLYDRDKWKLLAVEQKKNCLTSSIFSKNVLSVMRLKIKSFFLLISSSFVVSVLSYKPNRDNLKFWHFFLIETLFISKWIIKHWVTVNKSRQNSDLLRNILITHYQSSRWKSITMTALSLSLFISKTTIQAVAEWNGNVCSLPIKQFL